MSETWNLDTRTRHPIGGPSYPSPRRVRRALAFAIDFVIHLGVAYLVYRVGSAGFPPGSPKPIAAPVVTWILVSFVHRTVVQSIYHATLGKWLLGLCVVRPVDGRWPTFGALVWSWILGFVAFILFQDTPTEGKDGFPLVVRRRDVRQ